SRPVLVSSMTRAKDHSQRRPSPSTWGWSGVPPLRGCVPSTIRYPSDGRRFPHTHVTAPFVQGRRSRHHGHQGWPQRPWLIAVFRRADASGFASKAPRHLQNLVAGHGIPVPGKPASADHPLLVDQEKRLRRDDAVFGHLHPLPRLHKRRQVRAPPNQLFRRIEVRDFGVCVTQDREQEPKRIREGLLRKRIVNTDAQNLDVYILERLEV